MSDIELAAELPILMITQSFPPIAEVGGLRVSRLCRYLPTHGIRPVVLTIDQQFAARRDETLPDAPGTLIRRTTLLRNPLDAYGRWKAHKRRRSGHDEPGAGPTRPAGEPNGFVRRQTETLFDLLQTPDRFLGWYLPAIREAAILVREQKIAAIFSTGPAWTAHLIARQVKRRFGLPWLADFRDPWAWGNPWHRPAWIHRIDRSLEASCIRKADRVICITDALRREYAREYASLPDTHFVTLTGGYDEILPPIAVRPHTRKMLVHLGSIYADRRIDTFCEALENLIRDGRLAPGSFTVLFLGHTDQSALTMALSRFPHVVQSGSLEFLPERSWRAGQEILWNADVLLLFQGSHRLQVPAKFYEYLATGKPIFAVAESGALTDLLDATDSGVWADPGDVNAIADGLVRALSRPSQTAPGSCRQLSEQFHYRSLSGCLAAWVGELVTNMRGGVQ